MRGSFEMSQDRVASLCGRISEALSPLLRVPRSASLFDPLISRSDVTEIPARGRAAGLNLECLR